MPKKEKTPKATRGAASKDGLRTLAVRVSSDEFELVHKAAGPRKLSEFLKAAILTAAGKKRDLQAAK